MNCLVTVFESFDFRVQRNCPCKLVVVEFEATTEQSAATKGPLLEQLENKAWKRLFEIAGAPPHGWSSWLGGFCYHQLEEHK